MDLSPSKKTYKLHRGPGMDIDLEIHWPYLWLLMDMQKTDPT